MWKIRQVKGAPEGTSTLDCAAGEVPMQYTLQNSTTKEIAVVQGCVDPLADPCVFLRLLSVTYTPNDWTTECPGD